MTGLGLADPFLRSIHQTAGTVIFASGRIRRGWVTEIDTETNAYFNLLLARQDETPTSGRELNPGDDDRVLLCRLAYVEAWEYAGEDDWW